MVEWWWLIIVFGITSIGTGLVMGFFKGSVILDLQAQNKRLTRRVMEQRAQDYIDRVGGD